MKDSETFGAEKGKAKELVSWMNAQAKDKGMDFEARLYNYDIMTKILVPLKCFPGWAMHKQQENFS